MIIVRWTIPSQKSQCKKAEKVCWWIFIAVPAFYSVGLVSSKLFEVNINAINAYYACSNIVNGIMVRLIQGFSQGFCGKPNTNTVLCETPLNHLKIRYASAECVCLCICDVYCSASPSCALAHNQTLHIDFYQWALRQLAGAGVGEKKERARRWRWKGRTEQRRKNRTKITNIKWKGKGILEVKQRIRCSAYWYCKQLYLKSTNLLMSAMFCNVGSLCPNTYNNIVLVSSNFMSLISEEKHEIWLKYHSFKMFIFSNSAMLMSFT